ERAGERGYAGDRHGGTGEEDQRQRRGVDRGGRSSASGAEDAARGSRRGPKTSTKEIRHRDAADIEREGRRKEELGRSYRRRGLAARRRFVWPPKARR